jgi:DNA-binding CsgD family transcriptional regulator
MVVAGWYSGRAGRIMHESYNTRMLPGESVHRFQDGVWKAQGGPVGETYISVELRPKGLDAPVTSSMTTRPSGSAPSSVSNVSRYATADDVGAAVLGNRLRDLLRMGLEALLKSLEPVSRPFALHVPAMPLTFGAPRSLTDPAEDFAGDADRAMLLDVFAHLGRAAAIVGRHGRILHLNPDAERLAGDGFVTTGRVLRAARSASQPALDRAIERALQGERGAGPVALERIGESAPLLAQAMPMSPTAAGEKSVLVLFTDPARRGKGESTNALRLLGLTPAEARLASLVGSGRSPKEASEQLCITENTARSVLKTIYDKLAINRQSELAHVVARIESV